MEQAHKDGLKVTALTQRIAQLVAQYEEQMADYRADATIAMGAQSAEIEDLKSRLEERNEAPDNVPTKEGPSE